MRCYNGCPDTKFQSLLDRKALARQNLRKLNKEARCVYFPGGDFYEVWENNKCLSSKEHKDEFEAINEAIRQKSAQG